MPQYIQAWNPKEGCLADIGSGHMFEICRLPLLPQLPSPSTLIFCWRVFTSGPLPSYSSFSCWRVMGFRLSSLLLILSFSYWRVLGFRLSSLPLMFSLFLLAGFQYREKRPLKGLWRCWKSINRGWRCEKKLKMFFHLSDAHKLLTFKNSTYSSGRFQYIWWCNFWRHSKTPQSQTFWFYLFIHIWNMSSQIICL